MPKPLADDYIEADVIHYVSPRAVATLIRRCLQGMIRDFWGVKAKILAAEIEAIKDRIDSDTWEAIEAIRKIGNIDAHMGRDINLIIDVEPGECEMLFSLVESLFDEWYVNRKRGEKGIRR